MHGDGSAATAMLGLAGFVLLAVSEFDGELEQAIESTAVEEFCRGCGVRAVAHGRRPVRVRDLPAARSAGDADLGEADVAVRRVPLPSKDVVGDQ